MKILFSIILNAIILYIIVVLLWENTKELLETWITLWCWDSCTANSLVAWKTFLIGWVILGILNTFVKPILKVLSLPFYILSLWLFSLVINAIVLGLLTYILNDVLQIAWVGYTINWWINFVIAVAIFSILNMFYSLLFFKR